ncbi:MULTISPECIES: class IIb bacteriocin, lactobin A/cerein 7B family [Cohnella]|uniref:class IIb bacteriocin, lactobin A/cerein 7B family n=1 Tax=Cohnella TaxID=329857 RepID=UPI001117D680|nr:MULTISPECIES: Blp family class II bacteriocin [Cohnella]MBN2981905.1 Blp family class II bacteriocin [Cohnella algarum]
MTQFIELNEQELKEVDGGGLLGAIAGGVIGGLIGVGVGMVAYTTGRLTGNTSTSSFNSVMRDSMMASAGIGMSFGALAPTP